MHLHLKIWRQKNGDTKGQFVSYELPEVDEGSSFLEMLDIMNEQLVEKGEAPVAFDHDCREGICGMCSLVINGEAHGPERATTACQLHMRHFKDGDTITIEPWRAKAFPVVGGSPLATSCSLRMSSISRKDESSSTSGSS